MVRYIIQPAYNVSMLKETAMKYTFRTMMNTMYMHMCMCTRWYAFKYGSCLIPD